MKRKAKVLAFVDYYLPGYKGGGPAISVSRCASVLQDVAQFFIFTRDRDLGESAPYPEVVSDWWNKREEANVFYASPRGLGSGNILEIFQSLRPDTIYLNSFFSRLSRSVLILNSRGWFGKTKVVIAPRGEFSKGALGIKTFKKRLYLWLVKRLGLCKGVYWMATAEHEKADIARVFGDVECEIVPEDAPATLARKRTPKKKGECRFVLVSRIARMKNIELALRALQQVQGNVTFTIYGPNEDQQYWLECLSMIEALPESVRVDYAGPVHHDDVAKVLAENHFFLLPTRGENFCHAISEALAAGLPCVISDQTPWNGLYTAGAGWTLPLDPETKWVERLQECIDMGKPDYDAMTKKVEAFYASWLQEERGDGGAALLTEQKAA